jgi:hypothetical protein
MSAETASRRVDVFFYGLFVDKSLLRAQGLQPQGGEQATVEGFALQIGRRATLVPSGNRTVHGVMFSLTLAELNKLYSDPSVAAYMPHAVLARLPDGQPVPALCYSLRIPRPPNPIRSTSPNFAL